MSNQNPTVVPQPKPKTPQPKPANEPPPRPRSANPPPVEQPARPSSQPVAPKDNKLQPNAGTQSRPVTPLIVHPAKQAALSGAPNLAAKSEPTLGATNPQQGMAVPTRPVTPSMVQPMQPTNPAAPTIIVPPPPLDTVNNTNHIGASSGPADVALLTDGPKPQAQREDFDVIFVGDVPASLECRICGQVLRLPQRLPCNHLFCLSCLKGLSVCPTCSQPFNVSTLKVDKPIERQIQQLPVKCSFNDNGCLWQGVLRELKLHAIQCAFADTICPRGCGEVYAKNAEAKHLEECTRKTASCEHCHKEVSLRSMKSHLKLCPSMIINCPNRCGVEQKTRAEIQEHLPNCPRKGSICPFAEFGCTFNGGRENIQRHIKEQLVEHLSFVCFGLFEFKELVSHAYLNLEKMTRNSDVLQGRIDALEKLYGAQYIWRIDNYRKRFEDARSNVKPMIFSPPFLSGRHGYKMIISTGLFGDGPARGQYMSIYVCVLKGEHDDLLSWPFVHKVTLTIMDQNPNLEDRRHLVYAIKPSPTNENQPYLQKPVAERNAAFGAQKFCQLNEVQPFVREDVLFIKCSLDTEHMIVL